MRRKLCVVTIILILLINIFAMNVKAISFSTTMTPNNTKVPAGGEFMVIVKLSNLDVGEDGINTYTAILGYDSEVFEPLTGSSVEGSNSWMAAYASGSGKITLTKTTLVKSDEEIMQISLKVKDGVADGTKGEISLSGIFAASPESELSCSDVSTTITVGSTSGGGSTSNIITNNVPSQIPVEISNNSVNINSNKVSNNASNINSNVNNKINVYNTTNNTDNIYGNENDSDMPYTGTETADFIRVTVGIIIIALLIYRKMKEYDEV